MIKTIKIVLIIVGFIVLLGIKLAFEANGSQGGMIWAIFVMAYLAYVRAIWKYKKNSDTEDKLDKTLK